MKAPIEYIGNFAKEENTAFDEMWDTFPWVKHGMTPRVEAFFANESTAYTYGKGAGVRTYHSSEWNKYALSIKERLRETFGVNFEVCFANGYANQKDHLGWHADDSKEVDADRPIAIVSFGVAREIWFCEVGNTAEVEKLVLEPGSLCLMSAGMQATHWHRIPKSGFTCGRRISLTYRGLASTD